MLDAGYSMLDNGSGYWIIDTDSRFLKPDAGYRKLDTRILDT